ncbi:MAG TPA: DUF1415 family protein [Polyangiaceae bacterium]|nr:DUF1415 family protein [Polyangiaceae bacterium]
MLRSGVTFRDDLTKVTLDVYERYAVEVVERFGFCPWARTAREFGSVTLRVVFSVNQDDFAESLALMQALHAAQPGADIALFIYPLLDLDRLRFEDFVRRLRTLAEAEHRKLDDYAMAAFHPMARADLGHADRLVPYVRRSPDPTLQLVRKGALSRIKGLSQGTAFVNVEALSALDLQALSEPAPKAVRERIAEQNLTTVRDVGTTVINAVLSDIFGQREAAHASLESRYGQRGPLRLDPG